VAKAPTPVYESGLAELVDNTWHLIRFIVALLVLAALVTGIVLAVNNFDLISGLFQRAKENVQEKLKNTQPVGDNKSDNKSSKAEVPAVGDGDGPIDKDLRITLLLVELQDKASPPVRLYFAAENMSENRLIQFDDANKRGKEVVDDLKNWPWNLSTIYTFKVTDEHGNAYHQPAVSIPFFGSTGLSRQPMRPQEFRIFELQCLKPVERATRLFVELPSPINQSKQVYRFTVDLNIEVVKYTAPIFTPPVRVHRVVGRPPEITGMPEVVTRTILFKRPDFQQQFDRWNRLLIAKTHNWGE
jgi:hypothetical protein